MSSVHEMDCLGEETVPVSGRSGAQSSVASTRRQQFKEGVCWISKDPSVKLLEFADDTTLIGLIQDGDESAYRQEVKELAVWCSLNNLELNTLKTVEMIVDFRRNPPALPPLTIMNSTVTAVESLRFLGTTISQDLKWDIHIDSTVRKAQQRLYFLRQLRKFNLPQELLKQLYSAIIESVLCTSITVWFSSATKSDLRRLRRVVRTAERIIGTTLPTLQELYLSRVSKKAGKITLDPSCAVIRVEGEEQWGENAALRGSSAGGAGAGWEFPQPHKLLPVCQEDVDPLTDGSRDGELCQFILKGVRDDGVKSGAEVYKQDPHISPWSVQMLQDEVQSHVDCIIHRPVCSVGKLQGVQ